MTFCLTELSSHHVINSLQFLCSVTSAPKLKLGAMWDWKLNTLSLMIAKSPPTFSVSSCPFATQMDQQMALHANSYAWLHFQCALKCILAYASPTNLELKSTFKSRQLTLSWRETSLNTATGFTLLPGSSTDVSAECDYWHIYTAQHCKRYFGRRFVTWLKLHVINDLFPFGDMPQSNKITRLPLSRH